MPSDFILKPDFVLETTPNYQTLITQFENGVEQRRPRRGSNIRSFKLMYKNRVAADLTTVKTLFDAKLGSYGSFTWDNPDDGSTYTVRFKADSFTFGLISAAQGGIYNFDFELIQVL